MIAGLFLCAWLVLWRAPDTSLGRLLRRWMLDRPLAAVARITRGHVLLCLLLIAFVGGAVWLFRAEAGPLLGLATPDIGVLIASFEVTTWLDVVAGAALLATSVRWRSLTLGQLGGNRPRPRCPRRSRRPTPARANDDEPRPWRVAA